MRVKGRFISKNEAAKLLNGNSSSADVGSHDKDNGRQAYR
jgi:hypothetical protein